MSIFRCGPGEAGVGPGAGVGTACLGSGGTPRAQAIDDEIDLVVEVRPALLSLVSGQWEGFWVHTLDRINGGNALFGQPVGAGRQVNGHCYCGNELHYVASFIGAEAFRDQCADECCEVLLEVAVRPRVGQQDVFYAGVVFADQPRIPGVVADEVVPVAGGAEREVFCGLFQAEVEQSFRAANPVEGGGGHAEAVRNLGHREAIEAELEGLMDNILLVEAGLRAGTFARGARGSLHEDIQYVEGDRDSDEVKWIHSETLRACEPTVVCCCDEELNPS